MTTAAPPRSSYRDDPSGQELRRALLLPTRPADRPDPAAVLLTIIAAVILLSGLLQVVTA